MQFTKYIGTRLESDRFDPAACLKGGKGMTEEQLLNGPVKKTEIKTKLKTFFKYPEVHF